MNYLLSNNLTRLTVVCFLLFFCTSPLLSLSNAADDRATIKRMLDPPEEQIDLPVAILTIDKIVDPSIDIEATLQQLDEMASNVRLMYPAGANSDAKTSALLAYIYTKGPWNNYTVFSYNLDDPFGHDNNTRLLTNYLKTRKGNCVSMPTLFVILGQKIGLNVTFALAPNHMFVHYTDDTGKIVNIETTSGGTARDVWIRQQNPMTDESIKSGIYMRSLNKKESIVAMFGILKKEYFNKGMLDQVIWLSKVGLEYDPLSVDSMLCMGAAYGRIAEKLLIMYHYRLNQKLDDYYQWLRHQSYLQYKQAESLGWRLPPPDFDEKYLSMVKRVQTEKAAAEKEGH